VTVLWKKAEWRSKDGDVEKSRITNGTAVAWGGGKKKKKKKEKAAPSGAAHSNIVK